MGDEEARGAGEGMGPAGQHRHRAPPLGGQGQVRRGREPVLSGEDGVHPGRAEEHLQAEGAAGGPAVMRSKYFLSKLSKLCCTKLFHFSVVMKIKLNTEAATRECRHII